MLSLVIHIYLDEAHQMARTRVRNNAGGDQVRYMENWPVKGGIANAGFRLLFGQP